MRKKLLIDHLVGTTSKGKQQIYSARKNTKSQTTQKFNFLSLSRFFVNVFLSFLLHFNRAAILWQKNVENFTFLLVSFIMVNLNEICCQKTYKIFLQDFWVFIFFAFPLCKTSFVLNFSVIFKHFLLNFYVHFTYFLSLIVFFLPCVGFDSICSNEKLDIVWFQIKRKNSYLVSTI